MIFEILFIPLNRFALIFASDELETRLKFECRFNRRYDLAAMMPRLGYVAVRTPPMPYRLLKLAEDHA